MSSAGTPGTRKRGRPRRADDSQLSPLPAKTALSAIKRQKLNTYGSSTTSKGVLSSLKKGFVDLLGTNQAKENVDADAMSARDELTTGSQKVEGSENGNIGQDDTAGRRRGLRSRKSALESTNGENAVISSPLKSKRKAQTIEVLEESKRQSDATSNTGRRRRRRGKIVKTSVPYFTHSESEDREEPLDTPSKPRSYRKPHAGRDLDIQSSAQTAPSERTPRRRGRPRREEFDLKGPVSSVTTALRKESRKNKSNGILEHGNVDQDELDLGFKDLPTRASSTASTPLEKGSKPKKQAKSTVRQVLVEEQRSQSIDELSLAKPKKSGKSTSLARPKIKLLEKDKDESDDSEIACAICEGFDSESPNEILLCEGCDIAVHQKCYDVPEVPEDDWFCRECQPGDHMLGVDPDEEDAATTSQLPDIQDIEQHLQSVQRVVLDKITGQRRVGLREHDEEMQKVHQLVEQTIVAGEGNSMLVIGSRGSGKTNLVDSVLSNLSEEHRDIFHTVRLNGLIHTDDKIASREIWRQLGREMEIEDENNGKAPSYGDALASLLALLSHPSEMADGQADHTAKSVIFILDEYDLFATHPRQTLLYNLFDIAQARKAPIAVLGLTTKIDVVESLEKRVKSRFSHRYVYLSLPKSLPAFWDVCKEYLCADEKQLETTGFDISSPGQEEFLAFWNSMIDNLYSDSMFKNHLQSQCYQSKSVPNFLTSCIIPISSLSATKFPLTGQSFRSAIMSLSGPDSKLHVLQGLSELELSLLISAARLDIILDADTCNFAMAYEEYSSLNSRHKIQTSSIGAIALGGSAKVWSRDVALGAWERLGENELLVPAGQGGGAAQAGGLAGRMWKVDVALEEISGSVDGLSAIMLKWCREI